MSDISNLLKPRWKTLCRYPDSPLRIGQIITGITFNVSGGTKFFCEDYPAIFQPLQWWEDRKESEMPEYVKMDIDCRIPIGTILKANWESYTSEKIIAHRGKNPDFWIDARYFQPATLEEYTNYINKQKP